MSINNLSSGWGGINQLNARPTFLREDGPSALMNAVERYTMQGSASAEADGSDSGTLFNGGEAKFDYRAMAQSLLARLDALRDRYESRQAQIEVEQSGGAASNASNVRDNGQSISHQGWWHGNNWYATSNAPTAQENAASAPPVTAPTQNAPPPPTSSSSGSGPTQLTVQTSNPTIPAVLGNALTSNAISLNDGATTIANTTITGGSGIVGDNATHVTSLNVSNVVIQSTNYGIYLGEADNVNLSNVNITCDPTGGDSYSVRGHIRNLVSSDSTFNSGIKAYRIYGLEGGSSTRDTYTGDRLMLGGGYSNEWGSAAAFHNFTFKDGSIDVNSVELYNDTNNVTFENMDFSGTGHISIQAGAHDITFRNCTNLPHTDRKSVV